MRSTAMLRTRFGRLVVAGVVADGDKVQVVKASVEQKARAGAPANG